MTTPAANDDGNTASLKREFKFYIIFFPVLLLIVASCNNVSKALKIKQATLDSIAFIQQQKFIDDSTDKADANKKKIYLTFDDGPNDGTMNVFNAVKEAGIPASFFIIGMQVYPNPEQNPTWQKLIADNAIQLCNHSTNHARGQYKRFYQDPSGVVKDIKENQGKLHFTNPVVRMPGRNAWRIDSINFTDIKASKIAIDSVHKAGFAIMGWDVEWEYSPKTFELKEDAEKIMSEIKNMLDDRKTQTPGHLVVLAHDQEFRSKESIEQLRLLFKLLKDNPEYKLVLAAKYPGVKKYDVRNLN
jgi:hypothetical protein